jgi:hypothetical protein
MRRRCGCDCLAAQLTWFGTSLNSTAAIGQNSTVGVLIELPFTCHSGREVDWLYTESSLTTCEPLSSPR